MESQVTETKPDECVSGQPTCQSAAVPVTEVLGRVGSKWTVFVIMELARGPKRFSELKRRIEGISQKMLTATLRDLEEDGFITRAVTPTIPPRVDYAITEMGRELTVPLATIADWAVRNRDRVSAARERYAVAEAERREQAW